MQEISYKAIEKRKNRFSLLNRSIFLFLLVWIVATAILLVAARGCRKYKMAGFDRPENVGGLKTIFTQKGGPKC